MNRIYFFLSILCTVFISSCDKVDNPFPKSIKTDLDTTIYPGTWAQYIATEWPDFDTITSTNPNRNALIEDFTGHNCPNCPNAATIAHNIHTSNPERVFVASVHAANTTNGLSSFQAVNIPQGYTVQFYNPESLELGSFFGSTLVNSGFYGNPSGTISRKNIAGEYFMASGSWQTMVSGVIASPPQVAIKAHVNYYDSPKHGYFLHAEVEKLDNSLTNDLAMVVYLIEDSLIGPQNVNNILTADYVHRDIFRGTVDGQVWGRTLTPKMIKNGKYYLDYSGIIPDQLVPQGASSTGYNPENMHLLLYVYDKTTLEIYQVIKKEFIP